MADAQGSIFWYNERWYDYVGAAKTRSTLGLGQLQHPDHVERTTQRLQEAWSAGDLWEDTSTPRQGWKLQVVYRTCCSAPDSQGSVARWFGTCTISAIRSRRRENPSLNSQLQQRFAELETIMQVLPVGVAVSQDPGCEVVTGNAALNQILGAELGENISLAGLAADKRSFRMYQDGRELHR